MTNTRNPLPNVDYDPNAPMCQDDYEYLTGTGQYSPTKRPTRSQFANGSYRTTSKAQDNIAQALFRSFPVSTITMGTQFDQPSGICEYHFYGATDGVEFMTIRVNRAGNILPHSSREA